MRIAFSLALRRWCFCLSLLSLACASRAQSAAPPLAFSENAVSLAVAGGTLHGTELVPALPGKVPVVLLHAGSGPTDRNGNSTMLPGPNDALRMLAEALARNGIASVRYDKRLIGASVAADWRETDLRFDDYINDAAAWIARLRADARFSRVIAAGHSEGALIALLAARRAGADGYVSIAGVARSADEVLRVQLTPKLPPQLLAANERILAQLKEGKPADDVPPALAPLYRASVQPYLISWFKYVPRDAIAQLTVPVLIVQGTSDIQVSVDEARALGAAAPRAQLVIIEGMNHVLKMVGPDAALQQRSYSSPDLPVSPQLVAAITSLVNTVNAAR